MFLTEQKRSHDRRHDLTVIIIDDKLAVLEILETIVSLGHVVPGDDFVYPSTFYLLDFLAFLGLALLDFDPGAVIGLNEIHGLFRIIDLAIAILILEW